MVKKSLSLKASAPKPRRRAAAQLGFIHEDVEFNDWEEIPEELQGINLAEEDMGDQDREEFNLGIWPLTPVLMRWRRCALRLLHIASICLRIHGVATMWPQAVEMKFDCQETCPHPPWAVEEGRNAT
eukprot:8161115-Pyramimonas_sp.AAC.1